MPRSTGWRRPSCRFTWHDPGVCHRAVPGPGARRADSIGEWDWDSSCLAVSDRVLGRRFTHLLCDQMQNGLIVRELPWRWSYGFTHVTVTPQLHLSREPGAAFEWLIRPATREFVRSGALTPGKARGFWAISASVLPPAGTSWLAPTTR